MTAKPFQGNPSALAPNRPRPEPRNGTEESGRSAPAPESEAADRAFVESLRAPVLFFDRAGKMRYLNAAAQRLLGDGLSARLEAHLRTRADKSKVSQVKFRLADGAERVLRIEISQAQWMGEPGYQAFVNDVTPYLTAIQQLQQDAKSAAEPADVAAEVQKRTKELAATRQELEAVLVEHTRMQQEEESRERDLAEMRQALKKLEAERDSLEARLDQSAADLAEATRKLQEEAAAREQAQREAAGPPPVFPDASPISLQGKYVLAHARKAAAAAVEDARRKTESEAAAPERAEQGNLRAQAEIADSANGAEELRPDSGAASPP